MPDDDTEKDALENVELYVSVAEVEIGQFVDALVLVLARRMDDPETVAVRKLLSEELMAEASDDAMLLAVLPCAQETADVLPLMVALIAPVS